MKITVIGSTQYVDKFEKHKLDMVALGHDVRIPAFDHHPELDALGICKYNRALIEWADEIHIIWDCRSTGTVFDFGMAFALRKPVRVVYLEPKKFEHVILGYETESNGETK
jgi:nucleoside 2-deoxyribosyltransferase